MTDKEGAIGLFVGFLVVLITWQFLWWFSIIPGMLAATFYIDYIIRNREK